MPLVLLVLLVSGTKCLARYTVVVAALTVHLLLVIIGCTVKLVLCVVIMCVVQLKRVLCNCVLRY